MKTLNFTEESKDVSLPLDKKDLAEKIAKIDPKHIYDYISGLEYLKQRNDKIIAILYSHGNVFTNDLIGQLNETELTVLEKMVNILNDIEIIDRVDELTSLSLNRDLKNDHNNESEVNEMMSVIEQIESQERGIERVINGFLPMQWS